MGRFVTALSGAVVVIPAHNESANLPDCLKAVVTAAACSSMPVLTVVVLDACDDGSVDLAGRFGSDVHFIEVDVRNVGASRRRFQLRPLVGIDVRRRIARLVRHDGRRHQGGPELAVRQAASGADVVLGVVRIANWRHLPAAAVRRYLNAYRAKRRPDGHGHVHGANMGFRADAYWRVADSPTWPPVRMSTWSGGSRSTTSDRS
jgi:hypothetical protein